ncbi:unnamed protein product [Penicillium roqueforti FM164]|uniref:Genomic scaffold, ProqFM164S03 n=1 Tax=Penicillium roqueforti (strain FM164) TaxID=1365484 RepID=W6QCF7_PENRF|nr:unnamed protein product [Penicillium roqueforti FM164]
MDYPAAQAIPHPVNAPSTLDLERNDTGHSLMNQTVQNFSWQGLTVTVKDRETKRSRDLVSSGELVALMGTSGCDKTTPLNVLARRIASAGAKFVGENSVNSA